MGGCQSKKGAETSLIHQYGEINVQKGAAQGLLSPQLLSDSVSESRSTKLDGLEGSQPNKVVSKSVPTSPALCPTGTISMASSSALDDNTMEPLEKTPSPLKVSKLEHSPVPTPCNVKRERVGSDTDWAPCSAKSSEHTFSPNAHRDFHASDGFDINDSDGEIPFPTAFPPPTYDFDEPNSDREMDFFNTKPDDSHAVVVWDDNQGEKRLPVATDAFIPSPTGTNDGSGPNPYQKSSQGRETPILMDNENHDEINIRETPSVDLKQKPSQNSEEEHVSAETSANSSSAPVDSQTSPASSTSSTTSSSSEEDDSGSTSSSDSSDSDSSGSSSDSDSSDESDSSSSSSVSEPDEEMSPVAKTESDRSKFGKFDPARKANDKSIVPKNTVDQKIIHSKAGRKFSYDENLFPSAQERRMSEPNKTRGDQLEFYPGDNRQDRETKTITSGERKNNPRQVRARSDGKPETHSKPDDRSPNRPKVPVPEVFMPQVLGREEKTKWEKDMQDETRNVSKKAPKVFTFNFEADDDDEARGSKKKFAPATPANLLKRDATDEGRLYLSPPTPDDDEEEDMMAVETPGHVTPVPGSIPADLFAPDLGHIGSAVANVVAVTPNEALGRSGNRSLMMKPSQSVAAGSKDHKKGIITNSEPSQDESSQIIKYGERSIQKRNTSQWGYPQMRVEKGSQDETKSRDPVVRKQSMPEPGQKGNVNIPEKPRDKTKSSEKEGHRTVSSSRGQPVTSDMVLDERSVQNRTDTQKREKAQSKQPPNRAKPVLSNLVHQIVDDENNVSENILVTPRESVSEVEVIAGDVDFDADITDLFANKKTEKPVRDRHEENKALTSSRTKGKEKTPTNSVSRNGIPAVASGFSTPPTSRPSSPSVGQSPIQRNMSPVAAKADEMIKRLREAKDNKSIIKVPSLDPSNVVVNDDGRKSTEQKNDDMLQRLREVRGSISKSSDDNPIQKGGIQPQSGRQSGGNASPPLTIKMKDVGKHQSSIESPPDSAISPQNRNSQINEASPTPNNGRRTPRTLTSEREKRSQSQPRTLSERRQRTPARERGPRKPVPQCGEPSQTSESEVPSSENDSQGHVAMEGHNEDVEPEPERGGTRTLSSERGRRTLSSERRGPRTVSVERGPRMVVSSERVGPRSISSEKNRTQSERKLKPEDGSTRKKPSRSASPDTAQTVSLRSSSPVPDDSPITVKAEVMIKRLKELSERKNEKIAALVDEERVKRFWNEGLSNGNEAESRNESAVRRGETTSNRDGSDTRDGIDRASEENAESPTSRSLSSFKQEDSSIGAASSTSRSVVSSPGSKRVPTTPQRRKKIDKFRARRMRKDE